MRSGGGIILINQARDVEHLFVNNVDRTSERLRQMGLRIESVAPVRVFDYTPDYDLLKGDLKNIPSTINPNFIRVVLTKL